MGVSVGVVDSASSSYVTLLDEQPTVTYVGKAAPNSSPALGVWQIKRIQVTGTVLAVEYADGDPRFDNIWDNRASLTYA